jgi:P27 family predicted phage terminase small subunit
MGGRGRIPSEAKIGGHRPEGHRTRAELDRVVTLAEADAPRDLPVAPARLGEDGAAAWTAALESAPWLRTKADFALVEMWGSLHDEKRMLADLLIADGPLTRGSTGQTSAHPALAALRAVEDRILKVSDRLGLGLAASARLGVSLKALLPPEPPSPGERLVADRLARHARGREGRS